MQPKAYVPGIAVLLTTLLAGCTGSDGTDSPADGGPGGLSTTAPPAQPGRYRTLPEPCGAVTHDSLDALLPGIKQLTDKEQREAAYEGQATQTFDTDRRVGCRWKVESTAATDHLLVDFERVVSYDNAVSGDSRAKKLYAAKALRAHLPVPSSAASAGDGAEEEKEGEEQSSDAATPTPSESAPDTSNSPDSSGSPGSADPGATGTPAALQPRRLDDLGDEAFLNDQLSTARQRTVTVVFRTSNVIVTIEYAEQPASTTEVPDSKEMQYRVRKLAMRLAESFEE